MTNILLLATPGGAEWILIIAVFGLLIMPILAIVFYIQNRSLKKEVARLSAALHN